MKIDRSMSTKTWKEIDGLLWQIEEKALKAEDWETAKDADRINALLRSLANEIQMEDDNLDAPTAS
jgi:hypothetical protein